MQHELCAKKPYLNSLTGGNEGVTCAHAFLERSRCWDVGSAAGGSVPFRSRRSGVGGFGADFGVFPLKHWMEGNDSSGGPHWSHGPN